MRAENLSVLTAIFVSGLVGMAAQVIGLRQLTAVFQGNELTIGLMLACWLSWTAFGSWIGSRLHRAGSTALGLAVLLQAALLPATLWLIRSSRGLLNIQPGQIVGLFPIFLAALMTLLPIAICTGWCFSLGCHAWRYKEGKSNSSGASGVQRVYIAEAAGAAVGGLCSFFLAPVLEPFPWAIFVGGFGAGAGLWALLNFGKAGRLVWGTIFILGLLLAVSLGRNAETATVKPLFAGQEIAAKQESPYGQLVATRLAEQTTVFINGIKETNFPDPFAAEEVSHLAMALHPNPQHIILIGGIVGETPGEILKHPSVQTLDLVELDPELIEVAKEVFPDSVSRLLDDPRVTVWHRDGRRMMTTSEQRYHVILMDLPDPLSAQVNRYYTEEWFEEIRRHLDEKGVFSFSVQSSENVMNREQIRFLSCIYRTLHNAIPHVKVVPGANAHFLASPDSSLLELNADRVLQTLKSRGVETVYVSSAYLPYLLQPYRVDQLEQRIQGQEVPINRDIAPVGYYTGLVLWDTHFRTSLRGLFLWLRNLQYGYVLIILAVATAILLGITYYRKGKGRAAYPVAIRTAIFTVGSAEIGMEILMILGFQVVFGVAYGWVAILMTAFMVGLALGAQLIPANRARLRWFIIIQICVIATPVALWLMVIRSQALTGYHPGVGAMLFGLGALIAGALGGAQFPIAAALLVKQNTASAEGQGKQVSAPRVGGGLYALDLLGSSLGAIILSAFIVPLWGLGSAFVILAILNIVPLAILRK
jgi:spermidine synthase